MKPKDFNFVVNKTHTGSIIHRGTCGHAGRAMGWKGYDSYADIPKDAWRCRICCPAKFSKGNKESVDWDKIANEKQY